jgi:peptidoglycan/xylan/chitin deacetylase (PgdA/CDA1 family)
MLLDDFRAQIAGLATHFEMASLESAVDFMSGEYRPRRDLCLLTFDDGLKEHYTEVTPILHDKRIRAVFFPITGCLEDRNVAAVHMNDFLLASMDFEEYSKAFFSRVAAMSPDGLPPQNVDVARTAGDYPWDTPEVARFKHIFHFCIDPEIRDRAVREIFAEHIGDETTFAESLYLSWDDVRKMQKAGMAIGGHSHRHNPLANLTPAELASDLETCHHLLHQKLLPQPVWSFSYPYGRKESFHLRAVRTLQELNFRCAFSTEASDNRRGADKYMVGRTDCKKALIATAAGV